MISGKPVWLETSLTAIPAPASSFAVPPVERISTWRSASARAKSTSPVLSETERSARRTRISTRAPCGSAVRQAELAQFLAQRAAVDAENVCGAALVAVRVVEHSLEQRFFDFAQDHVV